MLRGLPALAALRRSGAAAFFAGVFFFATEGATVDVFAGFFAAGAGAAASAFTGRGDFSVFEGTVVARVFRAGFFGASTGTDGFFRDFFAGAAGFSFAAGAVFFWEAGFSFAAAGFPATAFAVDAAAGRFVFGVFSGAVFGAAFFLTGAVFFVLVAGVAVGFAAAVFLTDFFAADDVFFSGAEVAVFLAAAPRFSEAFELLPAETVFAATVFFFFSSERAKDFTPLVPILPDSVRRARKIF